MNRNTYVDSADAERKKERPSSVSIVHVLIYFVMEFCGHHWNAKILVYYYHLLDVKDGTANYEP